MRKLCITIVLAATGCSPLPERPESATISIEQVQAAWDELRGQPIESFPYPKNVMWPREPFMVDPETGPAEQATYGPYVVAGHRQQTVLFNEGRPVWAGAAVVPMVPESLLLLYLPPMHQYGHGVLYHGWWLDYSQEPHTLQDLGELIIPSAYINQSSWVLDADGDGDTELIALRTEPMPNAMVTGEVRPWSIKIFEREPITERSLLFDLDDSPPPKQLRHELPIIGPNFPLPDNLLIRTLSLEQTSRGLLLKGIHPGGNDWHDVGEIVKDADGTWKFYKFVSEAHPAP